MDFSCVSRIKLCLESRPGDKSATIVPDIVGSLKEAILKVVWLNIGVNANEPAITKCICLPYSLGASSCICHYPQPLRENNLGNVIGVTDVSDKLLSRTALS
jgi:hypothetical protein